ncbi:hypothetical protein HMPREF9535_00466 [Escherichia coli MS 78-1]|nr:hypothetical protein HMPREF9535_00466 [Escherichia coli MS 78-1]
MDRSGSQNTHQARPHRLRCKNGSGNELFKPYQRTFFCSLWSIA